MQPFLQRNRVLILHLSFWCVYLSFFLYQITSYRRREIEMSEAIVMAAFHVAFNMVVSYMNYFIFLPRFLKHKKVLQFLLEFSIPFVILMIGRVHFQRYLVDGYTHQVQFFYETTFIVQAGATSLFIVIFVAMLRFLKDWFELEGKKKELDNEKLMAELNFLKAQINPHFLFNTLNNLYYLAYSQSPNTTEVIAKLSQMMRYMIYDTNHSKVLLKKEIEYMQNYISLERLRLNDQTPVDFQVNGPVEDIWITPLIFITFLENAFKHGIGNGGTKSWVKASLHINGKECIYSVENSKVNGVKVDTGNKSGIGLQNVQRRLELSYPGQYALEIKDQADRYFVQLNLKLA